ncbi:tetratricopeptide repeat protein, partial [Rhizobium sp.]
GRRRHEAALAHFRAASALAPDHHSLHVDIAGELRALGQLDEAEAECHQALAREPGLANAYRTLGIIARERGDHLGALRNFTAAQAFAPDSHWLFLDAAQECRSLQRYDDALEQCRISLTIAPPLPEAHRLMGFIESDRGDMIAARDHFHHALELFEAADMAMPGHFIVGIAELLLQLGDVAAAGARLEAGGSGVPSHMSADVLRLKAAVARREMDYDRELRHLQSILELLDDKTEAYLALIDRQIARGRLADAGETVRRAMLQYPQHPGLRIQQAQIFRLSGRADDCGRALLALLHSGDLSLPTRIGLAHEFRHNKMLAEARGLARSAVEIAPSSAQAWLSLVHVDLDTEGPIVALGRLQESMDIVSGHRETVLLLCRLLRETGQSEAACDFLEQGGLTWRSPASLFQEYVSCAILTGRSGKAREMLALRQLHNPGDEDDFCAELDLEMASGNSRSLEKMLARMSGRPVMRASIASRVAKIANATYNFDAVISMQASWIKLDPLHELPGMIAIAQAEFYAGREARGIAVLGDLREKFGPVPDICIVLAEFSRVAGRIEEARSILREGFAEQPDSVALFSHLVRLLIQTGALDEATSRLAAPTPPTQKWREEVSLLSMELCLERRDFRGCLEMMEAFAPSYTRDRGRYYQFAAKAALWDLDTTRLAHVLKLDSAIWQLDRKLMRQSTNMTQSLMGQLLDDFRLDVATVSTLRKARELPADQQTEALLATAGANPDSTAAALALVLHLRKAGMLEGRRRHAALIIPKRILQFWDTPKVPPDITAYMETWRRVNPGWTHELFDSSTALEFVAAKCAPDVRAAFLRARDATMKSDLFRLAWLHEGGGVYADADDVCTGPLHSVVAGGFSFVGYQEDLGSVGNNFIAVAPRHPMISLALEAACTAILRGDGDMVWLSTGPGLLSRAFATWLSSCPDLADALSETLLLERGELTAVCAPHCHASYKFTPKHWSKGIFG